MIRKLCLALAICTIAAPALAQQADPALMQNALIALQQQRNAAMDGLAQAQAQAATEIAKLKARIAELEKAAAPPVEPAK